MRRILSNQFFNRPTVVVARELLGKFLVRRLRGREIALMVTEVEAYDGPFDRASHASRGRTERNKVMFGPAGFWYVYFTYGIHWMLNIVTGPKDYPAAVLIRGAGDISGPGRLTKFLRIDRRLNGKKANRKSGLWFEERGVIIKAKDIKTGPRVGVAYAGPIWAKKPYRFILSSRTPDGLAIVIKACASSVPLKRIMRGGVRDPSAYRSAMGSLPPFRSERLIQHLIL